jgi:hypothetical protein
MADAQSYSRERTDGRSGFRLATQGRDAQRQDGAEGLRADAERDRPGIRAGKLHYRLNSIDGNPFLRLLHQEVEALVNKKYGEDYLRQQQAQTELARLNRKLKRLRTQVRPDG